MKKLLTSIYVLAVSSLLAVAANAQSNLLVAGDFEGITSLTTYSAATTGVWGTESSVLSGAGNGVTPFGSQMLELRHAGGGGAAQTNQIVYGPFKAGSVVTFSVKFNTWLAASAQTPQTVAVIIQTDTGLALTGTRYTSPTVALDTDTSTWQTATVTTTLTSDTNYLSAEIVLWMYSGALPYGTPLAYADDAVLTVAPPVYASGLSSVTGWDPIFPAGPVNPDSAESTPVPSVGYNDPRWTNPHAATVFPKNSHPWEYQSWVPSAFKFDANWINAWSNLNSNGHGKTSSSPGWAGYPNYGVPYQSWTKYSTTVVGSGTYVLQFLADNASWIYVDGTLVGYQDYWWANNGTGRYTIQLTGSATHDLGFVIWDGGGLAGGKFRLETKDSFLANNPGATLPPAPATVTLSNLTQTYDGTPKTVTVTTAPSGLTTSVTYNGSPIAPTAAGSYSVVATVTDPNYLGSATGTLTINKAPVTFTLGNLAQTYDGTVKSITVSSTPAGVANVINYLGDRTNAGNCPVQVVSNDPNYTGTASDTLVIAKANATVSVSGYTGTYDGAAHGATGSATGVGGASLGGLNLGGSFTDVPGGTAHWTFTGGTNYNSQSGDVAIVITKANATITVNGYTGIYDATAHGATGTATGVGGAALAGLNLGASFTDAPGGTANWTFTGGTNYNDASGSAAIVINKASATITVNGYTGIYDAAAHGATGSVTGVGGVPLAGLNLGASFTDAPGGTANWSFTGGTNYNDASGSAAIVISKANATITVNGYTGVYDATAHGATGTVTGLGGAPLAGLNLGASFTDAPGGTANWSFAGGTNYNDASGSAAIVISKADATITVDGYTGTYDATAHGATGTVTGVGGVDLSSSLTLGASFTNVPGGTANWSFAGGTNYNDASGTASIVITKANALIAVNGYTGIYDAAAHGATGTVTGVGGVALPGLNLGATFTSVPGGTANWSFTGGTNYNDASGSAAIVISKADATITVDGYTGVYDATAHGATGTATGVGGVDLSSSLTLGASFTNVPGGTANWSFAGGTNYNDASGTASIVITKAPAAITVSGYTGTYDGLAHGATGSATGIGGVNLSGSLALGATFTGVPGGTANWSFTGGTNYADASGSVAIVINKATATVGVAPYDVEYDGQPHSATVTSITGVNGESGAAVGVVTLNTTHTSVGIYSADSWSFAGANYNSLAGTITDTIKDTTAPVITSLSTNAPTLWPPNHKMVPVTVSATATDLVGVTSLKIISVTSSEPDNGLGDGDTANDIQITGALSVNLRAERSGHGNGRIYTITVQAMDAAGNASTQTITVVVPHEQGGDQDDDHGGKDNEGGKGGNDDHGKKGGNDDHGAKSAKDNKGGKGK